MTSEYANFDTAMCLLKVSNSKTLHNFLFLYVHFFTISFHGNPFIGNSVNKAVRTFPMIFLLLPINGLSSYDILCDV